MSEADEGALLASARRALSRAGVDGEVWVRDARRAFARFGSGTLTQHVELCEPFAMVRVARGTRLAEVTTDAIDEAGLVDALHRAAALAVHAPEDPGFPGFAGDDGQAGDARPFPSRFAARTAAIDAGERTSIVARVLDAIAAAGLVGAGGLETRAETTCVATSAGAARAHRASFATFRVWASETAGAGGASGFGHAMHRDVDALAIDEQTAHAIRLATMGRDPITLPTGAYDVVLEPAGVAELLEWLAMTTFGAKELAEGTSLAAGRRGEQVLGEQVTIAEDPLRDDDDAFGAPFDREGTRTSRVPLVARGVSVGALYDRAWAARAGTTSTGNAPPRTGWPEGPQASTLRMEGGAHADVAALIADVERGLYVGKLHYVNGLLEPRRAVMTGLTRDGTFLIEDGRITRAVTTMRFSDSIAEASFRIGGMTERTVTLPSWWSDGGTVTCPAVLLRRLSFVG